MVLMTICPQWCVCTVLPDTSVFSPLTVTPSPDVLALKLQQVVAKTTSGESRLLRKARQQKENGIRGTSAGREDVKVSHKFISPS